MTRYQVVSLSGGKDSTAMLLFALEDRQMRLELAGVDA